MGVRKTRAGRQTYHRQFAGILCRAPKGRRWTKPSVIVEAIDLLAMKQGAIGLAPLREFAVKTRDTLVVKPLKRGQDFPNRFPSGNKGNVFLEYAWAAFQSRGAILSEQDVMAHLEAGKVMKWYNTLTPATKVQNDPVPKTNKRKVKRQRKKAEKRAESEKERAKRVGDAFRAEMAAAKERQTEFAQQYRAEQALIESLKAKLKDDA